MGASVWEKCSEGGQKQRVGDEKEERKEACRHMEQFSVLDAAFLLFTFKPIQADETMQSHWEIQAEIAL